MSEAKRRVAKYIRVSDLAARLGVHRNTIHYWINQHVIAAVKIGTSPNSPLYISNEDADRLAAILGEVVEE